MRIRYALMTLPSLAVLAHVAACGGGGTADGVFSGGGSGSGGGGSTRSVTLSVTGTAAQASVRTLVAGTSNDIASAPLPWTASVSAQPGQIVSLSATNLGNLGSVTVEISAAGSVPQSNTTNAGFGTATVSFTCC